MSLLTGQSATNAVLKLASKLIYSRKTKAEQLCGRKFDYYSPWMSYLPQIHNLSPLFSSQWNGGLICNREQLQTLQQVLMGDGSHPLAGITPININSSIDVECLTDLPHADLAVKEAAILLSAAVPWMGPLYHNLIRCIIPIEHRVNGVATKRGFSSHDTFGAIFLSFRHRKTFSRTALAIDLAHEIGHHALMVYQAADPIFKSNRNSSVYSGVRKTNRPAVMALHASAALAYMIEFATSAFRVGVCPNNERDWLYQKMSDMILHQTIGLQDLASQCTFTRVGSVIHTELVSALQKQQDLCKGFV